MSLLDGIEPVYLDLDCGRARVLTAGEGPPILLVHGWPAQAHLWRHVMRELAPTHRVIAPDLPWCGETTLHPDADLTLAGYATFLDEVTQALGVSEAGLGVHDAGGPIGLHWATRWPGRIRRLCLLNTLVFPELCWAARLFFRSMDSSLAAPVLLRPAMIRAGFHVALRSGSMDPEALDAYAAPFKDSTYRQRFADTVRAFDASSLAELPGSLDRIADVPMALFYGARDILLPDVAQTMQRLQERYPHAQCTAWPDLGHFVQEDAPERVATAVADFFRSEADAGPANPV